jgi:hypothetical protein
VKRKPALKAQSFASLLKEAVHSQKLLLVMNTYKLSLNSSSLAVHLTDVLLIKTQIIKSATGSYSSETLKVL